MKNNIKHLGDIADFINGVVFKPSDWKDTGRRIIRIQNLTDSSKPYNRTEKDIKSGNLVSQGDLLVSWSATLGVYEWDQPDIAAVNQHIFKVIPHEGTDRKYLKFALSFEESVTTRKIFINPSSFIAS